MVLEMIGVRMPLLQAFKISLVSNTFAQLLPVASGGDIVRVWQCVRTGMRLANAMSSVLLERLAGLLALIGMLCLSLPALAHRVDNPAAQISLLAALLGLTFGMLLLFAGRYVLRPFDKWRLVRFVIKLSDDTHKVLSAGKEFTMLLAISVAGLLAWCFAVYIFVHAVHLSISLLEAVILVLPVILILALPFSLTGWGVREGAMVLTLSVAGLDYDQALLVSLITGFAFLLTGLPGIFIMLFSGKEQYLPEGNAVSSELAK